MSVMRFVRTYQRMEEEDPVFLYHDRVCCTGETRQETYSRPEASELRDKLDEILGDRRPVDVDALAQIREHVIRLVDAIGANPAARDFFGAGKKDDIVDAVIEWAKSYREPEPSPDPPEDLENAVLSVITDEWLDGESAVEIGCDEALILAHKIAKRVQGAAQPSPDLKEALGAALRRIEHYLRSSFSEDEIPREIGYLADYLAEAVAPALPALTSEEAEAIRTCAETATAWAPSRTAEDARQLIGQARIAVAAAERLSGAKAADDEPSEVAREQWERDTIVEGVASNKARLDKLESLCLPGLDERVTRLERHAGEAQHALGTDGGEIGLHREQIGDITRRIEEIGLEIHGLQNWRRPGAHLPADAEALAALVDAAVERAVEPIKNRAANAHRLASKAIVTAGDANSEAAVAAADAKRVWTAHVGDFNKLHARIQALELHRAGLTDGQAEVAAKAESADREGGAE